MVEIISFEEGRDRVMRRRAAAAPSDWFVLGMIAMWPLSLSLIFGQAIVDGLLLPWRPR